MNTRSNQEEDTLRVRHLMTTRVLSGVPDTTLQQAIQVMVREGFRHLPIVRDGVVVAMVSDRDLRLTISEVVDPNERRDYLTTTRVGSHATHPVISIRPDALVADAAQKFLEHRIGCLVVADERDQMLGIITQSDLLRWLSNVADCPVYQVPRVASPTAGAV